MKRYEQRKIPLLRILPYGQPGTGKTGFCGTFDQDERTARTLFLNAAGNPIRIMKQEPAPIVLDIESIKDFNLVYSFISGGQNKEHKFRELYEIEPEITFKTVVIDTITEVQRMINLDLMGIGMANFNEEAVMRIQDWGTSLTKVINLVNLFYSLPVHVIITAQERAEIDDATSRINYKPYLQGQAVDIAPAYAEIIGRMRRMIRGPQTGSPAIAEEASTDSDIVTVMYFESAGKYMAKNQVDLRIGKHMANPSATKILDLISTDNSATKGD